MRGQMQLLSRAQVSAMRDWTRSRNHSAEREEFRREHKIRRDWGLAQRHATKLRRLHGSVEAAEASYRRQAAERLAACPQPSAASSRSTTEAAGPRARAPRPITGNPDAAPQRPQTRGHVPTRPDAPRPTPPGGPITNPVTGEASCASRATMRLASPEQVKHTTNATSLSATLEPSTSASGETLNAVAQASTSSSSEDKPASSGISERPAVEPSAPRSAARGHVAGQSSQHAPARSQAAAGGPKAAPSRPPSGPRRVEPVPNGAVPTLHGLALAPRTTDQIPPRAGRVLLVLNGLAKQLRRSRQKTRKTPLLIRQFNGESIVRFMSARAPSGITVNPTLGENRRLLEFRVIRVIAFRRENGSPSAERAPPSLGQPVECDAWPGNARVATRSRRVPHECREPRGGSPARHHPRAVRCASLPAREPTSRIEQREPTSREPTSRNPTNWSPPGSSPPGSSHPNGSRPNGESPPGGSRPSGEPTQRQPTQRQPTRRQTTRWGFPPGGEPPGAEPPGAEPPGGEPPGAEPPGGEPPGAEPPGGEPPGAEPTRRGAANPPPATPRSALAMSTTGRIMRLRPAGRGRELQGKGRENRLGKGEG
jgi:hypothetical protein